MITEDLVKDAYLKLKNFSYYDNLNFFLRDRIAQFENRKNFERAFKRIADLINDKEIEESKNFAKWLDQINYQILPKKIKFGKPSRRKESKDPVGTYISNVRTADGYTVTDVTYFICAPIEIQLLDVLWIYKAGVLLDNELSDSVYGYRLEKQIGEHPSNVSNLFKLYINQYSLFRDGAINSAVKEIEEERASDVAIFSLDFEKYFYFIDLNFIKLSETLKELCPHEDWEIALKLTNILQQIHAKYISIIKNDFNISHSQITHEHSGPLPIGLMSSGVISNWYLKEFDEVILNDVNPLYYGRYVDDLLIVIKNPTFKKREPINKFVTKYFSKVMNFNDTLKKYELKKPKKIYIQSEKLILHFFDKKQSTAGLRLFKKKIEQNSSAFRFLPGSKVDRDLDEFAYDLLYDGSSNKLRSVIGLNENATELSKYLAFQIIAHRLSEAETSQKIIDQLFRFFKGKNYLDFCRLWEKVFSFAIIKNQHYAAYRFYNRSEQIFKSIDYVDFIDGRKVDSKAKKHLQKKLTKSLIAYLRISLSTACALLDLSNEVSSHSKRFAKLIIQEDSDGNIFERAKKIRKANMMRHNYVAYPLANYTEYSGSLLNAKFYESFNNDEELALVEGFIKYSPRFIHLDELSLFFFIRNLSSGEEINKWREKAIDKYKEIHGMHGDESTPDLVPVPYCCEIDDDCIKADKTDFPLTERKDKTLKVAIANIKVSESDIENSYRKDRTPNISFDRQRKLYNTLNACEQEQVDLLILPEVSIPHHWLPFMVAHSRRHQIGLVFGIEHWVKDNNVYNFIATALPYKFKSLHNNCFLSLRIKNHYAPQERKNLERVRLNPIEPADPYYEMFTWRGIQFAPYNCFELANLRHRAIFKSDLDLLVACVWNRDTNYYEKIMESVVRDLHCFVAQANTSDYGGSCVLQPTKTETMNIIKVKGGDNHTILTATLDIKKLREFQFKEYSETDNTFKPTPPGYDHNKVFDRGK